MCPCCFPACQCSGPGQYDGTCDSETGQCLCRTGFEGHLCNQCAPGYFSYPLCQCAYLSSHGPGWARTKPESSGRVLKENWEVVLWALWRIYARGRDRQFEHLEQHLNAHLRTSEKNPYGRELCPVLPAQGKHFLSVAVCGCSTVGTLPGGCDSVGRCFCRPEFAGPRCEQCSPGHHSYPHCYSKDINVQFLLVCHLLKNMPIFASLMFLKVKTRVVCTVNLAGLFWSLWIMPKPGRQSSFYRSHFLITALL